MHASYLQHVVGSILLVANAGCSVQPSSVQLGQPAGTLSYKKTPVAQVQVAFHSPGLPQKHAFGVTDAEGEFRLFTPEGAATQLESGEYLVTAENIGDPTWAFPSKYHDPAKTPLRIKVLAGEPIDINIP